MKRNRIYYHLLLDRSGSMYSWAEQTVDGINQQIRRIKEVAGRFPDQELITSLTLFNQQAATVWSMLRYDQIREVTFSDFRPEGFTALLDAIGFTIESIVRSAGKELDDNKASSVVVIITDGYDNASVHYTLEQVSGQIRDLENTGRWTFSYIGATIDAVQEAAKLSIKSENSMQFRPGELSRMFKSLGESLDTHFTRGEK